MKTPTRVVDALQFALVAAVLLAAVSAPDWLPPLLDRIRAAAGGRTAPAPRPSVGEPWWRDRDLRVPPPSEGGPVP